MLRKIAIVGANGFVGRHLLDHLVRQGVHVVGVVRSDSGAATVQRLGGLPLRIADLAETSIGPLTRAFAGCQGVVYTASVTAGAKNQDRTDPTGLVNALAACRESGVSRVVFFSGLGIAHYGMNPHCTNPYFLAKMAGEVALFRSGIAATVFRPSYIFGPGDEFLSPLIVRMAADPILEIPGDGQYRLQPISVTDTARAIEGALMIREPMPTVVDLVGPEAISYLELIQRVGRQMGRAVGVRERPMDDAITLAKETGYFGLRPHDLACLLCDEVSDPAPVESLVRGSLCTLDQSIADTLEAVTQSPARP